MERANVVGLAGWDAGCADAKRAFPLGIGEVKQLINDVQCPSSMKDEEAEYVRSYRSAFNSHGLWPLNIHLQSWGWTDAEITAFWTFMRPY